VADCFAQAPDVAPGNPSEPVADAPMDVMTSIVWDLTRCGGPNQVMCEPEHAPRFDGHAAR